MKKEFIVNRQGKDFVLYAGLLDQAHREGLKRISTTLVQAPNDENGQLAICQAEVETEKGVFSGIGDASPHNVGRMIAMHTVRMAETRAKARALRDAINVGVTAIEELGDIEETAGLSIVASPQKTVASNRPQRLGSEGTAAPIQGERSAITLVRQEVPSQAENTTPATAEQLNRLLKLQTSLGRGDEVPLTLSFSEAANQITELVQIFNAQARAGRKSHA